MTFCQDLTADPYSILDTETINGLLSASATITRKYQDGTGSTVDGRPSGFILDTSLVSGDDYNVTYTYDNAGRLSTVNDIQDTFTYGYKTDSNLIESVTAAGIANFERKTSYEQYRDVITQVQNKVGSTTISQYDYTVNSIGQRTNREQDGSAITAPSTDSFSYNATGELTGSDNNVNSALDLTYAYDGIGNRTAATEDTTSYSYASNLLNQYSSITQSPNPSVTPTYDDDGNMLTNGAGWTFTWNGENRLATATDGSTTLTFTYDYMGRRVRKDDGTKEIDYIYDGWNLIAVYDESTTEKLTDTYTWGSDLSGSLQGAGGVGGLLATYDVTNSENYVYTYDANGNVSELIDSVGNVDAHYEYDPFGKTVASTGTYKDENPFRFSTKYLDDETGMAYYGFRYYSPELGRWINRDPIGEQGGLNLFGFVQNSSINIVDSLGLSFSTLANQVANALGACQDRSFSTDDSFDVSLPPFNDRLEMEGECTATITWTEGPIEVDNSLTPVTATYNPPSISGNSVSVGASFTAGAMGSGEIAATGSYAGEPYRIPFTEIEIPGPIQNDSITIGVSGNAMLEGKGSCLSVCDKSVTVTIECNASANVEIGHFSGRATAAAALTGYAGVRVALRYLDGIRVGGGVLQGGLRGGAVSP